jgi:chemotaxis protein histidine kinase CheA
MGYTAVASLSHELETLLDLVRKGERTVDARLMDLLFRAADLLERAIESAVSGVDAVDVLPMVHQLQSEAGRDSQTFSSMAMTAELPVPGMVLTAEMPIPGTGIAIEPPVPDAWTVPAPIGPGMLVRIRLADGTPLKGVRAFLVIEAAKKLGEVAQVSRRSDARVTSTRCAPATTPYPRLCPRRSRRRRARRRARTARREMALPLRAPRASSAASASTCAGWTTS